MAKIATVNNLNTLINYLGTSLDWPVDNDSLDELVFEYEAFELGIHDENTVKIKNVFRFRPFIAGQTWSVFYIEFATGALPIVVMRRILNSLVIRQRAGTQDLQRWNVNDLLFISNFGSASDRKISFAHFTQSADGKAMPTLKVLGWDGDDTALRLDDVERRLTTYLKYPHDDVAHWPARWQAAFTLRPREVIKTSQELSKQLARLARDIRDRLNTVMQYESDKGPFTLLMKSFQSALIHDLTAADFADMYAQTIAYGLLSTRIADPSKTSVDDFTLTLQTNPFLRELLTTFLRMGGRDAGGSGIDFDELGIQEVGELLDQANMSEVLRDFNNRNAAEDPVIHFYELFLKEYDAKKRMQRGVFYTPKPVVGYIVRSVHELLQTEFGLPDGLAATETWADMQQRLPDLQLPPRSVFIDGPSKERIDPATPFVQILDPATGTGTFLVEVIDVIYRTLMTKWANLPEAQRQQRWNAYVPTHLLPRLYGYELMMAPYTIAHLKIGLKLLETGYTFASEQRANIYLTNALEPAQTQLALAGITPALAHEAAAVNTVKLNTRYTVVVGNPPYSGEGMNKGDWIRSLIETYMYVDGSHLGEKGKKNWLQDDYVKFIRYAQFELDKTKLSILGFVTNHSFLDNPTFRGMRASLRNSFPRIHVLDLHGNSKKLERGPDDAADENVFDIQQGVSIGLFRRTPEIANSKAVAHAHLWGLRNDASKTTHGGKYGWLSRSSKTSTDWHELSPNAPLYLFVPQDIDLRSEYQEYWKLTDVMPHYGAGIITSRDHFVIDFEDAPILKRLEVFRDRSVSDEWIRSHFEIKDNSMWSMEVARKAFQKKPIQNELFVDVLYRPYDRRRIYFETNVVFNMRIQIMRHLLRKDNLALITTRQTKEPWSVLVSRDIVAHKATALYDVSSVFPLFLQDEDNRLNFDKKRHPNFSPLLIPALSKQLGSAAVGLMPEDIFHYAYAVFHSPGYRSRYAEFLKIDFPRLPLTWNLELFRTLSRLGEELVALHLMESDQLTQLLTECIGNNNPQVEKISYSNDTVWVDKAQTNGFRGVPEAVWNFHIGGYQVCEKWLKDRKGRTLTAEDIAHYQKIVVALHETIRLMAEIDVVIEEHGGWPGAFHVADASVADEPARPQFGQVTASASKRKAAEDKDQGSFLEE